VVRFATRPFPAISAAHGFPCDFPGTEATTGLLSMVFSSTGFYCVVRKAKAGFWGAMHWMSVRRFEASARSSSCGDIYNASTELRLYYEITRCKSVPRQRSNQLDTALQASVPQGGPTVPIVVGARGDVRAFICPDATKNFIGVAVPDAFDFVILWRKLTPEIDSDFPEDPLAGRQ